MGAADLKSDELEAAEASAPRIKVAVASIAERVARAREILRGVDAELDEIVALAKAFKGEQKFELARRLFSRARKHPAHNNLPEKERRYLGQQHALTTYKDPDLSFDRFARALEILRELGKLEESEDPETLGLAGAIHKRMWQVEGQRALLERALEFYRRGHAASPGKNDGYNGINAAFLLDLLAREEARSSQAAGSESSTAVTRRDESRRIREQLIAQLPPMFVTAADELRGQWWFFATVAEAYFGLARYDEAVAWLRKGPRMSQVPRWEFESTLQQLGTLVQLHAELPGLMPSYKAEPALDAERAHAALRDYLGEAAPGIERVVAGKLGLALSGGGFRASLFHIGVLACLAERDALRHVEVLSCVSGGSIIGAHYYLEVQKLLSEKADHEITPRHYVDLVANLARDFLGGVQTNIRSQVLSELWTNLKAMFWPSYTRTQRLGELYESRIYSRITDGKGQAKRYMDQLVFTPQGESKETFKPKYDNWRRQNKVPVLVLNATTLNTGHNWQFTATWMGEPPSGVDAEIDGNYRLRRMYYDEAPERYRRVRLGHAVAASSCVPGIFEPLMLPKLYPDRNVGLVDGGVFDNQGTASLLEQDCTLMLVSDASGQMSTTDHPNQGILGVPLRSFSISMARVREAEYHELDARRRAAALRGLMFLHMKKDLDVSPVDWVDCQDPADASDDARPADRRGILTRFKIRKDVQTLLAGIRTDLDSFSEIEAYALMTSGYRMAEFEFRRSVEGCFPTVERVRENWEFLKAEPLLDQGPEFERVKKHLAVASETALKVWRLSTPWTVFGIGLLVALAGVLAWAIWHWRTVSVVTLGGIGEAAIVFLVTLLVGPTIVRLVRFRKTLGQIGLVTTVTVLVAFVFKLHLWFFDWLFLRAGQLSRFRRAPDAPQR